MLEAAKEDFGKVLVASEVRSELSPRFVELLTSGDDYA